MTPQTLGHLAMLAFSALVAGSFSLGSLAANEISPMALTAARFVIAGAVVAAITFITTGITPGAWRAPWRYVVLGGLFSVYFVLMFEGLKTAQPVSAAAIFTLTPLMAGLFGWVLLRQITTARMALALLIGAVGALWVIFRADWALFRAFHIDRGEMIYFVGCIAHALYAPLVRKLNRGEPALVFTLGMLIAGSVILIVLGWGQIRATAWLDLPRIVWICLLYIAVFASAATFVLLQFATMRLPASKVMAYTYLTPSWVICWEIALGNTPPSWLVLVGVAMTVLALLLLLRDDSGTPVRAA